MANPYLYAKVNEKLLNRWLYPLVPERKASHHIQREFSCFYEFFFVWVFSTEIFLEGVIFCMRFSNTKVLFNFFPLGQMRVTFHACYPTAFSIIYELKLLFLIMSGNLLTSEGTVYLSIRLKKRQEF